MTTKVNDKQVARMARGLREFGYPGVTAEEVRAWVTEIEAGQEPEDVCAMFVKNWLDEAGLVGGEGD